MPPSTVLVTGGSSGIGYALAERFAKAGHALILVAQNSQRLEQAAAVLREKAGNSVDTIAADLSVPNAPRALADTLERSSRTIDILVNSAGFAMRGPFAEADAEIQRQLLQVNIAASTHLTRFLLPGMLARGYGKILNVASTAAFQPGPLMAIYYASKAYVLSFSEALAREVRGSGVTVTALCPGLTRSGFVARAALDGARLVRVGLMDASVVAEAGFNGLMKGKAVVIPGLRHRIGAVLVRWMPGWLVAEMVMRLHQQEKGSA